MEQTQKLSVTYRETRPWVCIHRLETSPKFSEPYRKAVDSSKLNLLKV